MKGYKNKDTYTSSRNRKNKSRRRQGKLIRIVIKPRDLVLGRAYECIIYIPTFPTIISISTIRQAALA